jgi:GT2 family glycosyltransferase
LYMRLSVVIPNYNGEKLLPRLLPHVLSCLSSAPYASEVIVADDASTDTSVALLCSEFPTVRIVEGKRNAGFGGNCNRGAAAAQGEYIVFVNSDIVLEGDPFTPLLATLDAAPNVFAAMPLVYAAPLKRVENVQDIWISRGLPWLRTIPGMAVEDVTSLEAALAGKAREAALCGALFACRREVFNKLGGFSPAFGKAYWEDVDLGFRAKGLGFETIVVSSALVHHEHSQTMDAVLGDVGKRRKMLRNQAVFLRRNLALLKPVPNYRLYLLLRIPQRIFSGDWSTIAPYLALIFGKRV